MKIEVVNKLEDLRARQAEWLALYRRVPSASVFTSPGWVMNWIESFAIDAPWHCVFVRDENGLQAVLPMAAARTRWRRMPVVALTACTNAHSVRSALLFDPTTRDAAFNAGMRALRDIGGWDMLLLDGCDGPELGGSVPSMPNELPVERWQHSCLAMHGNWEDYLAGRSRDLRRNLRRAETDLAAMGHMQFELIEHDTERLFEQWVQVDRASWKATQGETVDSNAQTTRHYRGMLQQFEVQGQMLGGVLSLNGAPIAVVICARDKGICHTLKTAIREDLSSARISLGAVVMARLLAAVWSLPDIRLIDFVSKQTYTERWTSEVLTFERRVAFAASWRGQTAALLDRAFQRIAKTRSPAAEAAAS